MKSKTRSLKLIVALFCLCFLWIAPKLLIHVFTSEMPKLTFIGVLISLSISTIGVCSILYATFKMIYLFEHNCIFSTDFVRYLQLSKNTLLVLTFSNLFNFGLMPSIAIVHWSLYDICAFTIDFTTIFMFGIIAFTQLIICTIQQGIDIKADQDLTI